MSKRRKFTYREKCEVYARSNGRCAICGEHLQFNKMTIDHKTPLSKGGTNAMSNLQAACLSCNRSKCDMTPAEFFSKLILVACNSKMQIAKYCIMKMLGLNTKEERGVVA